jgi:cytochrome b
MTVNLPPAATHARRRVWDAPVRIVHALLIACVAGAWLTREAQQVDLHVAFGYGALALVAFRILWGFIGGRHARFASFAYSPRAALAYLRDAWRGTMRHYTGHNPAGSWAVYGLLALVGTSALSGVAAMGALYGEGPMAPASFAVADAILEAHELLAWAVLVLAVLHVVGALWGCHVHRENLPAAMITGRKAVHDVPAEDTPSRGATGALVLAAVATIALAYVALWSPQDRERRTREDAGVKAALKGEAWSKECGGCHLAYSPALLPFASWKRTLDEQDRHFGEDLGLGADAAGKLLEHAKATPIPSWAAWKLATSVPPGDAPLEISTTSFWRTAHATLAEADFKPPRSAGRHDCEACHRDAASGIFHPRMIHMAKGRVGN